MLRPRASSQHRFCKNPRLCQQEPKKTRGSSAPPRTLTYTMWADETADPPTLFCQVGSTQLRYQLRCIDDLHAWLVEQGDWVDLGAADEQKPAKEGTVEACGVVPRTTLSAAGTASARAIAAGLACTCRRSWRFSARPNSPTSRAITKSARSPEAAGASGPCPPKPNRSDAALSRPYLAGWCTRGW
jgi:Family of unknown function (DUF6855)